MYTMCDINISFYSLIFCFNTGRKKIRFMNFKFACCSQCRNSSGIDSRRLASLLFGLIASCFHLPYIAGKLALTAAEFYWVLPGMLTLTPCLFCAVFCRVYITDHSYVSIRTKVSSSVQEILKIVAERIQHPEEDLALVTVTFSGGNSTFHAYSTITNVFEE